VSEDLTHYDVLGVEPSADKDAIKSAYQDRLGEVQADVAREQATKKPDQGSIDGYRREEASIRSAWQVLSDPYQRGRYDATIELGVGGVADLDDDADGEVAPVGRTRGRDDRATRPVRERPPGLFSTEPLPTPSSWPPGIQPPPPRARVTALAIDMFVLMIIYLAFSIGGAYALEQQYPKETKQIDRVTVCLDRLEVAKDRDSLSLNQIERAESYCSDRAGVSLASASKRESNTKAERIDDALERADKRFDKLRGKTQGFQFLILGALLAGMLGYLVPSSVVSGKTFGKKLMQIRVVNADGSPVGFRGALARYALPVLVVLMLQQLGPIGFGVALFGVLTWPRNPNLQGLHDRLARTFVVDG
jgi:curved DNA-binding protein CbpA